MLFRFLFSRLSFVASGIDFVSFPLIPLTDQHHATYEHRTWNALNHDDAFPIGTREAKFHAETNYAERSFPVMVFGVRPAKY
jgi:hypothetical protein